MKYDSRIGGRGLSICAMLTSTIGPVAAQAYRTWDCKDACYGNNHANFCRSVNFPVGVGTKVYIKIEELSPGSVAQILLDGEYLYSLRGRYTWSNV